jgi:hypothetical protein
MLSAWQLWEKQRVDMYSGRVDLSKAQSIITDIIKIVVSYGLGFRVLAASLWATSYSMSRNKNNTRH